MRVIKLKQALTILGPGLVRLPVVISRALVQTAHRGGSLDQWWRFHDKWVQIIHVCEAHLLALAAL